MPAKEPTLKKSGDNVRARREAQDLSQEQLDERADLDRASLTGSIPAIQSMPPNCDS
ncbi:MAG: helix-turn-helix transcriptional regulator [Opitutaceae bacterium]|nr:helix-turn-helix transcriptional regulator [Opitutaceae bacterium]